MVNKRLKLLIYADTFDNRVGQTVPYMQFFSKFGEVILVHSQSDLVTLSEMADILVVPGGADVDASNYDEAPGFRNGRVNGHYQYLDDNLLKPWLEAKRPTIGVCRGMQAINVALGGSLHQHIIGHQQGGSRSSTPDLMTYMDSNGKLVFTETNSLHHQSVKQLGRGLELLGWSPTYQNCYSLSDKDNLLSGDVFLDKKEMLKGAVITVEAYKSTEFPLVAFQYHPEEFNCPFATSQIEDVIISTLV